MRTPSFLRYLCVYAVAFFSLAARILSLGVSRYSARVQIVDVLDGTRACVVIETLGCGGMWGGLGEILEGWGDGAFRVLSAQGMPRWGEHDIFWGI